MKIFTTHNASINNDILRKLTSIGYSTSVTCLGIEFDIEIHGQYRPRTRTEPLETPSVKILGATIVDFDDFMDSYFEYVEQDLLDARSKTIHEFYRNFGSIPETITFRINGVLFTEKKLDKDEADYETIHASIEDEHRFLDTLPEKIGFEVYAIVLDSTRDN